MPFEHGLRCLPLLLVGFASQTSAETLTASVAGSDIRFEGLIQADLNDYRIDVADLDQHAGDGGSQDHGMRRAELALKGQSSGRLSWALGFDAHAKSWLDVAAKWRFDSPRQHVLQLGQFKQPQSLEELSSTKANDLIAKAMTTNTFAVGRRLGLAWHYGDDDWGVTSSVFGRELGADGERGNGYALRATMAPILTDARILHLGISHVERDAGADSIRLRTRPQADLSGTRLVDTAAIDGAERIATSGLEAIFVHRPLKLQGEIMRARIDRADQASIIADGAYVSLVWNISGESWRYKSGVVTTAAPADSDWGLWQFALRHDRIDLDDADISGGRMDSLSAGINWYWRKHVKLMLNHVAVSSRRQGIVDNPDIIEARVQFHW